MDQRSCHICSSSFEISPLLRQVLQKLSVPDPLLCAHCSHQRRLAFRKDFKYHKNKSALSGKNLISVYHPDLPYKIYESSEWHSDSYDPLEYGRDFDFRRSFFDQYHDLMKAVPHPHLVIINSENCDYNNFIVDSRNCYMSARTAGEDIYYSYLTIQGKDCFDCYNTHLCELCYECVDCTNCNRCTWCMYCKNCSEVSFSYDCIGCSDCFGCVGLRNAKFHIFNTAYSEEEYRKIVNSYDTSSRLVVLELKNKLWDLRKAESKRRNYNLNSEDATGDYILNSRRVENSFDVEECEDIVDSWGTEFSKDIARSDFIYYGEKCYENLSNSRSQNIRFSYGAFDSHDLEYCMLSYNGSHDCFGSIGMKHNSYLILNKQYTREEYEILRDRIVEHMKKTGEYGLFFPPQLSLFPYNESVAQLYFPLEQAVAEEKGFIWNSVPDEPPKVEKIIPSSRLPDKQSDIPDDILNWAIACEVSGKPFRVISKELKFYRKFGIPVPSRCPDVRYEERVKMRNPRRLI